MRGSTSFAPDVLQRRPGPARMAGLKDGSVEAAGWPGRSGIGPRQRRTESGLDEAMTIARLIAKLKAARAEWEAALTTAPRAHWCEPGAAGAWSVKDVIVQVVYREQWCADRLGEALRGEAYAPCAMDQLPDDERSQLIYRQHRHRPLADVLAEAHFSYRRLVRAVEAHSDTSLAQPRAFLGEPEPRPLWQGLLSEVGEAYGRHGARLRAWLATGS